MASRPPALTLLAAFVRKGVTLGSGFAVNCVSVALELNTVHLTLGCALLLSPSYFTMGRVPIRFAHLD